MKMQALAFALLAIPLIAVSQSNNSFECTMGELVRRVVVERAGSAAVPCDVAYYKDSEAAGEREILWSAGNDADYCSARAAEFVARLQGMGWQCAAVIAELDTVTNGNDD